MKLAMSTNAFKNHSLAEAIATIGSIGFSGVEILADTPHLLPMEAGEAEFDEVRRRMEAANLAPANINAFTLFAIGDTYHPSWIEPSEAERSKRIKHTEASLRFAKAIGCPHISTEPGGPVRPIGDTIATGSGQPASVHPLDRNDVPHGTRIVSPADLDLDLFEAGVRAVLPVARQTGVRLLIEPEPELLIERWGQIESFLKRFEGEPVGINFDVGHFFCVGEDPADLIRRHASFIEHVHVEDIAATRVHRHLVPGDGAIDFDDLFGALAEIGYNGFVTLELYPFQQTAREVAQRGFDFLSKYFQG